MKVKAIKFQAIKSLDEIQEGMKVIRFDKIGMIIMRTDLTYQIRYTESRDQESSGYIVWSGIYALKSIIDE